MHELRHDDALKKSWSFISEDSFSSNAACDLPLAWEQFPGSDGDDERGDNNNSDHNVHMDFVRDLQRVHEGHDELNSSGPKPHAKRKRTVTFHDGIPVVTRKSSVPDPIQLLQEPPPRRPTRSTSSGGSDPTFFNHTLYGSLRSGTAVELFSRDYCGLAVSAASTGFLVPFLEQCFHPLLCDYLALDAAQADATFRFLLLPGLASFVIGVLSDFFPLWSLHRKAYMIIGWVLAYATLMALVVLAMHDFGVVAPAFSFTRFHGGAVYVLLMMGTSLGVTIATVAAFALVVELSQREPIHERGTLVLAYVATREVFTLVATAAASQAMRTDETDNSSFVSMKALLLIMAVVALAPVPVVLFRLDEDRRQLKVDATDRLSLSQQLWRILQQEAMWRVVLAICALYLLGAFEFDFVGRAVKHWANVDDAAARIGAIPRQALLIVGLVAYRYTLLNYSWVRVAGVALVAGVIVDAAAALPVVYDRVRATAYFVGVRSLGGFVAGAAVIVTTLPLVEVTETGIEGATTGLVASYHALLNVALLSVADALGQSAYVQRTFGAAALDADAPSTRTTATEFLLLQYGVNVLALAPLVYLLPRQKLDAQQMRTYGGYSKLAGVALAAVFSGLAIFGVAINVLALMHKLGNAGDDVHGSRIASRVGG